MNFLRLNIRAKIVLTLLSLSETSFAQGVYKLNQLSFVDKLPYSQTSGGLLVGYNSDLGSFTDSKCLRLKVQIDSFESISPSQELNVYVDTGSTMEDFFSSSSMHASASLGYGAFSGSAEYGVSQQKKISSFSQYLRAVYRIEKKSKIVDLDNLELSDKGKSAIQAGTFFQDCGTQFISGIVEGGLYDLLFNVKTSSENEQKNVSASLAASVSGLVASGSASASMATSVASSLSQTNTTYSVLRKGPSDAIPSGSIQQLLVYGNQLPIKVTTNAWPINWILSKYSNFLPSTYTESSLSNFSQLEIRNFAKYVRYIGNYINSLKYISENLAEFGSINLTVLLESIALAEQGKQVAISKFTNCATKFEDICAVFAKEIPNEVQLLALSAPERPSTKTIKIPTLLAGVAAETDQISPQILEIIGGISYGGSNLQPAPGVLILDVYDSRSNLLVGTHVYAGPELVLPSRKVMFRVVFDPSRPRPDTSVPASIANQITGPFGPFVTLCTPGQTSYNPSVSGEWTIKTYRLQRFYFQELPISDLIPRPINCSFR